MSPSSSIRSFSPADVLPCAEVVSSIPLFQKYGLTTDSVKKWLEYRIGHPKHRMYTAEIGGSFAGYIDLVEEGMFATAPYINQIAVDPAYASMGIGKALMEYVEAHHKNKYGISLLVTETNEGAIRFYERLGYGKVGRLEGFIRPGLNELIYFKK